MRSPCTSDRASATATPRAPTLEEARGNLLLAGLPADAWQRWQPQLELIELQRGDVL